MTDFDTFHLLMSALIGLFAGLVGGLLGVGGSTIIIPGLTLLLGPSQHLYQAAAMMANVAVSIPAALRHLRAKAVVTSVLKWMLPVTLVSVVLGVWISNLEIFRGSSGGIWLGRILAAFLIYEAVSNFLKLLKHREEPETAPRITPARSSVVGFFMGTVGGMLGIGGGAMAVPLQHWLLRLPLRQAIANSATVMVFSAAVGSVFKTATLELHHIPWTQGLVLAGVLAPSCFLGGWIGAGLTHRIPTRWVRMVFVVILLTSSWKMLAI